MIKEKMNEPEVSIYIALYYIKKGLTRDDVYISIDGAHVKTGNDIHFDIRTFLLSLNIIKDDRDYSKWQGSYSVSSYVPKLIIHSKPGQGDVAITTLNGKKIIVESKKGNLIAQKGGSEYPLMREAIGQLMTGFEFQDNITPVVAVPFSEKSYNLALKWAALSQIKICGIRFMLVKENGDVVEVL